MEPTKVIGFFGHARSGKDTATDAIRELLPFVNPRQLTFAAALKQDLKACEDMLKHRGYDTTTPAGKEMFRDMWVEWSKVAKKFEPMIWPNRLRPSVIELQKRRCTVIISDVRYDYEVDFVEKEFGGKVFWIDRPGVGPANEEELKESAKVFERFPNMTRIVNDVPLADFKLRVARVVAELGLNVSTAGALCAHCGRSEISPPQICSKCGASFCPRCIIYLATQSKYICTKCKNGG